MTTREFHLAFNIKLDKEDVIGYPSFLPEEIDFWLNQSVIHFVKTRYSGSDTQKGFQHDEKRDADLRNTLEILTERIKSKDDVVTVLRPKDYWLGIGESVYITSCDRRWPKGRCTLNGECNHINDIKNRYKCIDCDSYIPYEKEVDPLECTFENFTSKSNDYLGEHLLHANNARPLRLSFNDKIMYRTDGNYEITRVVHTYIKRPALFNFMEPDREYVYIPEHAHDEIVSGAVALALENISDPRYATSGRLEAQIRE